MLVMQVFLCPPKETHGGLNAYGGTSSWNTGAVSHVQVHSGAYLANMDMETD